MAINKKKYQQAILFFCHKLGGEVNGKKKLAKLLYFADFDLYEKQQSTVTGDTYKALPMGPYPTTLDETTKAMVRKGTMELNKVEQFPGYSATEVYKCVTEPDMSVFSAEERNMLERVAVKYGGLNGRQLENLTHAEAPYIATKALDEIPFELAFYRGTEFAEV